MSKFKTLKQLQNWANRVEDKLPKRKESNKRDFKVKDSNKKEILLDKDGKYPINPS